jgi:hypothetical protein
LRFSIKSLSFCSLIRLRSGSFLLTLQLFAESLLCYPFTFSSSCEDWFS